MKDEPLFELPHAPPLKRAKSLREVDRDARLVWTRYRTKGREPCDECITLLHEAGGVGPYARSARWRCVHPVTHDQDGREYITPGHRVLLLCNEHADARRKEDRT